MDAASYVVGTYIAYLAVSVTLTVWVCRTLQTHGKTFLVDVFHGDQAMADSVNRLLAVGFYLVNVGYITLALKVGYSVTSLQTAVEALAFKVGAAALVLGLMHFANLIVLTKLRSRANAPAPAPRPAGFPPAPMPGQGWVIPGYTIPGAPNGPMPGTSPA